MRIILFSMNDWQPEPEQLEELLRKEELLDERNLYRAVPCTAADEERIRQHGTDKPHYDTILALDHEKMFLDVSSETVFDYAHQILGKRLPVAILVYDGGQFHIPVHEEYRFKDPERKKDALRAILLYDA